MTDSVFYINNRTYCGISHAKQAGKKDEKILNFLAYVAKKQYLCSMKPLLDDYIFNDRLRYEGHKMIYTPEGGEPIVLGGILGAALLCVRLINTDEQKERGFLLSEEFRYEPFFKQYDSEVIADDLGYIEAELEQLDLAYLELYSDDQVSIETICPNKRQLSIALDLVATYMHRITIEEYGAHIWEKEPWCMPFAHWLLKAGYTETRRQRFLQMDWTDPALVHDLACYMEKDEPEEPVFIFEGEEAADIMARYWDWLWNFAQKDAATFPDSKVVMAGNKARILEYETNYGDIRPEMKPWMDKWAEIVKGKLKPEKTITFWTKSVTEEQQEALLDYLKTQERQPQRYKCLAVAVYTLRQLGYITYNISVPSIAKWLSERLQNDYSTKNGISQFRRAWNELRRFHPAVKDEVDHLAECGVRSIK